MAGRYRALLIGIATYPLDEHNLAPLKGPHNDTAAVRRALTDNDTGLFDDIDVATLADVDSPDALRGMSRFFAVADRHDVLLLYYSGHGKLDLSGRLHLCMHDTDTSDLLSTAVSSTRINEFVETSRARNMVIILDCCYSGAFRGGDFGEAVAGPGRYVLASCRGTQLANDATLENGTSYFTEHLVEGLLGRAADRDGDGLVDFSDVYAYIDRRLRAEGKQIPQRRVHGEGDLPLARRGGTASKADALQMTSLLTQIPGRRRVRRRLVVAAVAGTVVLAALTAFLIGRWGGSDTPAPGGHPRSGSYTSTGPFRFRVADGPNHPHSAGCTLTAVNPVSGESTRLLHDVYTAAIAQVAFTGVVRWTLDDSRCEITQYAGPGSITLPVTLEASLGDTDAFDAPPHVTVRVTDFNGGTKCDLQLVDAATGQLTDFKEVTLQAPTFTFTTQDARAVYLHQDDCGVRITAAP